MFGSDNKLSLILASGLIVEHLRYLHTVERSIVLTSHQYATCPCVCQYFDYLFHVNISWTSQHSQSERSGTHVNRLSSVLPLLNRDTQRYTVLKQRAWVPQASIHASWIALTFLPLKTSIVTLFIAAHRVHGVWRLCGWRHVIVT